MHQASPTDGCRIYSRVACMCDCAYVRPKRWMKEALMTGCTLLQFCMAQNNRPMYNVPPLQLLHAHLGEKVRVILKA